MRSLWWWVCLCLYCISLWFCMRVCVTCQSSLPPRLAAQHAHTGHVDAYEPPRHQVLKWSQRSYKSVCVGAVGIPVPRVDSQTARAARARAVARRLEEVLLLVDIVDIHVRQHCHLVAWDVRGFGLVAHPDADALTHWVNSAVLRLPGSPAAPSAGTLWVCWLRIRGLSTEEHPGWEVAAFGEEFGVHCGDGAGVVAWTLLLCCSSDGGHSLGTEQEEQDQHGRPHGHTTCGCQPAPKTLSTPQYIHLMTWYVDLYFSCSALNEKSVSGELYHVSYLPRLDKIIDTIFFLMFLVQSQVTGRLIYEHFVFRAGVGQQIRRIY